MRKEPTAWTQNVMHLLKCSCQICHVLKHAKGKNHVKRLRAHFQLCHPFQRVQNHLDTVFGQYMVWIGHALFHVLNVHLAGRKAYHFQVRIAFKEPGLQGPEAASDVQYSLVAFEPNALRRQLKLGCLRVFQRCLACTNASRVTAVPCHGVCHVPPFQKAFEQDGRFVVMLVKKLGSLFCHYSRVIDLLKHLGNPAAHLQLAIFTREIACQISLATDQFIGPPSIDALLS